MAEIFLGNQVPETRADRTFHLGGAGAPARACRAHNSQQLQSQKLPVLHDRHFQSVDLPCEEMLCTFNPNNQLGSTKSRVQSTQILWGTNAVRRTL